MKTGDRVNVKVEEEVVVMMLEDRVFPDRTCGQFDSGWWAFEPGSEEDEDAPMYFVSESGDVYDHPANDHIGVVSP